jgi:hypothetical protein
MFRVSHQGEGIDDADTIDGAGEIVRDQPARRYDVDEIRADPFLSGHTSRSWGRRIRHQDGPVEDEPWPWPPGHSLELLTFGSGFPAATPIDAQAGDGANEDDA